MDKKGKVKYLSKDEMSSKVAKPSQALAESQGTIKIKVATFNVGTINPLKNRRKRDALGRLWGRGSLFYKMEPPQKSREIEDFPWELRCELP